MRIQYQRDPGLLAIDVANARWRKEYFASFACSRIKPRMIGKRELLSHGVRSEDSLAKYLSLPENKERHVSEKTLRKIRRNWNRK